MKDNKSIMSKETINDLEQLKFFLGILGFNPKSQSINIWNKNYNDYFIEIELDERNFKKSQINYGNKIKIGRETTSNFEKDENLVVLECVNRLLEKGYKPESIELEKSWNLGHKGKGFLDVFVKNKNNQSFLMIECKRWGDDFEKEIKNTKNKQKKGSQIFSYLHQEPKSTKAISIYTSKLEGNQINYENVLVYNKEEWDNLNQEERFLRWNKEFENNGIFEEWTKPYFLNSKSITRNQLEPLTKEDGENIYNQFAEILRHNVISDKSNAFNKIINLFLCKIYDENRDGEEEVKFQIRANNQEKPDEILLMDLADLYKKGMYEYLEKEIVDYTEDELRKKLKNYSKEDLMDVYKKLRLYHDNDFAFREVFDERSFKENAKVVREIVELLEKKQLRYSHKQQFLGDFFEKLLKDSIKQESGQFFTPIPITQFIIKSLPLREFIEDRKQNRDKILPYVIDYACGAGHFLTEVMDEIDSIITNIETNNLKPSLKKEVEGWKINQFRWADQYIYGMDLDYRLVKTSKISCFLNGDGLAKIIHADGLDNFYSSDTYGGVLKPENSKENNQDNTKFDILISNPPYSVKAFKNNLKDGDKSFELHQDLTDNSSEIECLFVERAKQLLKDGGFAGIVLPVSILSNGKIYEKTREILLKHFDIKAILSMNSAAFMATGTKTIILFLQKKDISHYQEIERTVEKFFNNYQDMSCNGIEKAFSTYISENYDDLEFKDYISILKENPSQNALKSEFYKEYEKLANQDIREVEKEKLIYFILSYPQKLVLANSGEKQIEKEFYGYEWSNRRGYEGIHIYKDENGEIQSKLYNQDKERLKDEEKLNSYILNNYCGKDIEEKIIQIKESEDHPLKDHINYVRLSNLMEFDLSKFDKSINLNIKKKSKITARWDSIKLEECKIIGGVTYNKRTDISKKATNYKILTADNISSDNKLILDIKKKIYLKDDLPTKEEVRLKKDDILICTSSGSKQHVGKACYINTDLASCFAGGFMSIIRSHKNIKPNYLFQILSYIRNEGLFESLLVGNNINNLGRKLGELKIPLPPLEIQENIIQEISQIEQEEEESKEKIQELKNKIIDTFKLQAPLSKLRDISTMIKRGKSPKYGFSDIRVIKSGQIRGYYDFDFSRKYYVSSDFILDERKLKKGDILINSTGTGTAGRVNLFKLDGDFVVDSHVTILRLDNNKAVPKFVLYQLSIIGFKNIEKMATGQSGQIELSTGIIENIKITLPSATQQENIIKQIEPIEKEIEELQNDLLQTKSEKQNILDKYLK